jgi:hypothetical protein
VPANSSKRGAVEPEVTNPAPGLASSSATLANALSARGGAGPNKKGKGA